MDYYIELKDGATVFVTPTSVLDKIELVTPRVIEVRMYEFKEYDFMADVIDAFAEDPKILRKMKKPFKVTSIVDLMSILEKMGLVEEKRPEKKYTIKFGKYWRFVNVKTPAILIVDYKYYIIKKHLWKTRIISEDGEEEKELPGEKTIEIIEARARLLYNIAYRYCENYEKLREVMVRTPEIETAVGELELSTGRESTSLADWDAEYEVICGEVEEEVIREEEGITGRIYTKRLKPKTPIALVYYRVYQFIPDQYGTTRKLYFLIR